MYIDILYLLYIIIFIKKSKNKFNNNAKLMVGKNSNLEYDSLHLKLRNFKWHPLRLQFYSNFV